MSEKKVTNFDEKMLSAYERQRLQNIAKNNAVLAQLGLAGDNSLREQPEPKTNPPPNPKPPRADDAPIRRSARVAGKHIDYAQGLSHDFFCAEERVAEVRSQRNRKRPVNYSDEQAKDIEERERRADMRRRDSQRRMAATTTPVCDTRTTDITPDARFNAASFQRPQAPSAPVYHLAPDVNPHGPSIPTAKSPFYFVDGERGQCPLCHLSFVLTKKGTVRTHDCMPNPSLYARAAGHPGTQQPIMAQLVSSHMSA